MTAPRCGERASHPGIAVVRYAAFSIDERVWGALRGECVSMSEPEARGPKERKRRPVWPRLRMVGRALPIGGLRRKRHAIDGRFFRLAEARQLPYGRGQGSQ